MQKDLSLLSADLMNKRYTLRFCGHISDKFIVKNDSLMGSLNNQLNLGIIRPNSSFQGQTNTRIRLIHRPLYIFTNEKHDRFHGHGAVYLKLDSTLARKNIRWNINIHVSRGVIIYSDRTSLSSLSQAQGNTILNELVYEPNKSTSLDTLCIYLKSADSYIDLLFELIYTYDHIDVIAEDEPDNRQALSDYSTLIHRGYQANASRNDYAQTQRLLVQLSDDKKYLDETNPLIKLILYQVCTWEENDKWSHLYRANRTIYTRRYI
ncbi:unnamed protein product [Rotaria magnacalcarata]|uniref:Uncharacterized protein n=1 Tax=Rotaria magnacalcarata TaxID=392030 RepID=A0A8S2K2M5_9BILA|nr:unnamed protein product [Rotaria magnacalcarata]